MADEKQFQIISDNTQPVDVSNRFIAMYERLVIQTAFFKTKSIQNKWIKDTLKTYSKDAMNEALQEAHTKADTAS